MSVYFYGKWGWLGCMSVNNVKLNFEMHLCFVMNMPIYCTTVSGPVMCVLCVCMCVCRPIPMLCVGGLQSML